MLEKTLGRAAKRLGFIKKNALHIPEDQDVDITYHEDAIVEHIAESEAVDLDEALEEAESLQDDILEDAVSYLENRTCTKALKMKRTQLLTDVDLVSAPSAANVCLPMGRDWVFTDSQP